MRNLLQIAIKFYPEIMFLVLQFVCLNLVFKYNSFQQSVAISSASSFSGGWYEMRNSITGYFNLSKENIKLSEENARLRSLLLNKGVRIPEASMWIENEKDSVTYELLPVEVINSSYNNQLNYFTLNKGTDFGLKKGMGVLGSNGIVGVVTSVSKHFSVVMPLINKGFKASVEVQGSGYYGFINWSGSNHRKAQVTDIAAHADISVGDTIMTRGATKLYPRGIQIGVVEEVNLKEGDNYLNLQVDLFIDYSKIRHVYVLKNIYVEEQERIEEEYQTNE